MEIDDFIRKTIDNISKIDYIKTKDIPNIELYMDQITTFMDSRLNSSKRYEDDKILTKTMINNYTKNNLLPPPVKKKYSKEHILLLIFIYYYKNILSINDIQSLLTPITDNFFNSDNDITLEKIYEEVVSLEKEQIEALKQDVLEKYTRSEKVFPGIDKEEQEFLRLFSFICMLSFDIYVKKQMLETLIDKLPKKEDKKPKNEKK